LQAGKSFQIRYLCKKVQKMSTILEKKIQILFWNVLQFTKMK